MKLHFVRSIRSLQNFLAIPIMNTLAGFMILKKIDGIKSLYCASLLIQTFPVDQPPYKPWSLGIYTSISRARGMQLKPSAGIISHLTSCIDNEQSYV